ncbi:hypothetical protein MtrunA17_Chr7g0214881 [Medicago truncatula]|uniref:Transmembrane protein n=1 Tax=Medicago truncatula TaxID=3880 RepID=A0A396GUD8_MEDTR|nr:hypothetical protein MtrunA17_Chr7g0214881 [Medicago truncatula]
MIDVTPTSPINILNTLDSISLISLSSFFVKVSGIFISCLKPVRFCSLSPPKFILFRSIIKKLLFFFNLLESIYIRDRLLEYFELLLNFVNSPRNLSKFFCSPYM